MPDLVLTGLARQQLESLPRSVQEAVGGTIDSIVIDPHEAGKQLRGHMRGLWVARAGNHRVLYTIEGRRVVVRAILHRSIAYRTRPR